MDGWIGWLDREYMQAQRGFKLEGSEFATDCVCGLRLSHFIPPDERTASEQYCRCGRKWQMMVRDGNPVFRYQEDNPK